MSSKALSSTELKAPKKRRKRRSTEEIVDRLIVAAIEEFEASGYAGATTAAIARRAGVVEALLFKHFGSKANLFQDAIFNPLDRHFTEFAAKHLVEAGDIKGRIKGSREYIGELQDFIDQHSGMLMSLVVTQAYEPSRIRRVAQVNGLHQYFERMAAMVESRLEEKPMVDPKLMARVSFAAILACALFKDWLFPDKLADKDEIRAAVTDFIMEGLNANAAAGAAR